MPRFEPYIAIHSLGGPVQGDDKEAYADFLDFLLQQGVSFYSGKFRDDTEEVLRENFEERIGRSLFGNTYTAPFLTFPNLPVRGADLWLGTWSKEQTRSLRMNISGNDGISPKDFDALGEYLAALVLAVHRKLGAAVTVIESSERALAPYNPKTMPLWVGWQTLYSEAVQKKYGLSDSTLFPRGISATTAGTDLVVRHTVPFSEHILRGWDASQQVFWAGMKGRLLRKPGKYLLPPKDGETFIVEDVDEESGTISLKPLS